MFRSIPKLTQISPRSKKNLFLSPEDFKFGYQKYFARDGQHIRNAARGKPWNQLRGLLLNNTILRQLVIIASISSTFTFDF
jgi:hypothetical protein